MDSIIIHPTYFPSIVQMVAIVQSIKVIFEIEDNYQKQTYRNRTYIAHSNGKLLLNIPIKHHKSKLKQKTKDVIVENDFLWQRQHWRSLQNAYRTSPFFEYYEDDLAPLFTNKVENLLNFNFNCLKIICDLLPLEIEMAKTTSYNENTQEKDLRYLVNAKTKNNFSLKPYTQVLEGLHGYLPNLSILDLLFNEGPNAISYLENQEINF